jgi:gamma-butyrobetaine dioxygenase
MSDSAALSPALRIDSLRAEQTRLEIRWGDGHVSNFPSIWLLHACECPACGRNETGVRHGRLTDQPARPIIGGAEVTDATVSIAWGADHVSRFSGAWLRAHCLSDAERQRRRLVPVPWGAELVEKLPYMNYQEVAGEPETHLQFLETLRDIGVVLLRNAPKERSRTEEVAALVGKLRLTNYGIFELEAKPNPEIVGDMAMALDPHTDEPYRVEPPAITFFHVLQQADDGGDSTMVDGLWLAARLRERDPDAFEILATVPARHNRTLAEGRAFDMQAPIISRDALGQVTGVRLNDRGMAPVDCAAEQVEPFYDALRTLLSMIYDGEGMVTVKLRSGEMMVFNNQRLLHGRTAFNPGSRRHVRSCHVDLDEFHSRLRTVYRARDRQEAWMQLTAGVRP